MYKTLEVSVDTERKSSAQQSLESFAVNTNDYESVKLLVKLTQDKEPVNLSGATVKLAIRKPDRNIVYQNGEVVLMTQGHCEFELETQSYNVPGAYVAEVMIYFDNGQIVASRAFSYQVVQGILSDAAVESTSWYQDINALQQAVADLEIGLNEEINQAMTEATAEANVAATNATQAANLANQRVTELDGFETSITSQLADIETQKADKTNVLFNKLNTSTLVKYPSNFDHLQKINIYNNAGKFRTDFNPRSLKPARATTYYVNPILGKDTNTGLTKAASFKSIQKALSMSGDVEIKLEPGEYHYLDGWKGYDPAKGVSVVCDKGIARLSNAAYPRVWVEDVNFPGVFNAPTVYNGENLQAVSSDLRFLVKGYDEVTSYGTQITSQPQNVIELGTPGYIIGASNTKVRLPNNLNPNQFLEIKYALDNIVCKVNDLTTATLYLENVIAEYGKTSPVILNTSTDASKVVLINVSGNHSRTTDGVELTCNGLAVLWGCEASHNYQDGLNYYINQTVSGSGRFDVIEVECKGHRNGRDSTGTNNGTTLHSTIRAIRLNCNYDGNQNRNVHDVGGSQSFNVGVRSRFSQTNMEDFCTGLDSLGNADKMWLVGCDAGIVSAQKGATLYKDAGTLYATEFVTQTGVIAEFAPY